MLYRYYSLSLLIAALSAGCATTDKIETAIIPAENKTGMQTEMQKSSYAQGVRYMKSLAKSEIPLDQQFFIQGMNDVLNKKPLSLTQEGLEDGEAWLAAQEDKHRQKLSAEYTAKGKAFLDANKRKPGVNSLTSGVQYKVLTAGKGKQKPTLKDKVIMRYKITHVDGKLFSSPDKFTRAREIAVVPMIKGWQEALLLMPKGSRWEIYVPGPLAYGEDGAADARLGPNETMIFDVDLIDIQSPKFD